MVLVLSANANESPHIRREVERAVNLGMPIIPLRVEKVAPAKSLELFVSTSHWLDAFTPPLERHLRYLAQVIHKILLGAGTKSGSTAETTKAKPIAKEVVAEILQEAAAAMNEVKFNCSHCGQAMTTDTSAGGTTIACPGCGKPTQIPRQTGEVKPRRTAEKGKSLLIWSSAILGAAALISAGWWFEHQGQHPTKDIAQTPDTSDSAPVQAADQPAAPFVMPDSLKQNLVLWYRFDSADAGGHINDESGNNNDGIATGTQWTPDGKFGGALNFSPTDSHIRVPNNESLNPTQFTLAAWVKTSYADHYYRRVFDKGLFHNSFDVTLVGDYYKYNPPTKYRGCIQFEFANTPVPQSTDPIADG